MIAFWHHLIHDPEGRYGEQLSPEHFMRGLGYMLECHINVTVVMIATGASERSMCGPPDGLERSVTIEVENDGCWHFTRGVTGVVLTMPRAPPEPITVEQPALGNTKLPDDWAGALSVTLHTMLRRLPPGFSDAAGGYMGRVFELIADACMGAAFLSDFYQGVDPGPASDRPAHRGKSAWGLQPGSLPGHARSSLFTDILADTIELTDVYGEEALIAMIDRLNEFKPDGQPALERRIPRRALRVPALSIAGAARAQRAIDQLGAEQGANHLQYATPTQIAASLSRYEGVVASGAGPDYDAICRAITDHLPEAFTLTKLRDPRYIARTVVMKYSCGIPFEAQLATNAADETFRLRKRAHLFETGWVKAVVSVVRQQLLRGCVDHDIHHSFVKNYISTVEKLEGKEGAIRTIVAQTLVSYIRNMVFNYSFNKRFARLHDVATWAAGMPMSGAGYNQMAARLVPRSRWMAFDFTGFDASVTPELAHAIGMLRGAAYATHPDGETIQKWIHVNYDALQKGTIFDLLYGQIIMKEKGLTTGSASVTSDNCLGVLVAMMAIWLGVHVDKTPADFFTQTTLKDMSDDGLFGVDTSLDDTEVAAYVASAAKLGLTLRVEGVANSIAGLSFCRKTFLPAGSFASEFREAGIEPPVYTIVHDRESIAMRQTAIAQSNDPCYMYERTVGQVLLCSHNRKAYEFLAAEARRLRPALEKTNRGRWLLRKRKIPGYFDVIRLNYMDPRVKARSVLHESLWERYVAFDTGFAGMLRAFSVGLRAAGAKYISGERVNLGTAHAWNPPFGVLACAIRDVAPQVTTREAFRARVSCGPGLVAIDVDRFWDAVGDKMVPVRGVDPTGVIVLFQGITLLAIAAHRQLRVLPGLQWIAAIYELIVFDGAHVFAALSGMYYASTAGTNGWLANFVFRDPYFLQKRIAAWLVEALVFVPGLTPCLAVIAHGARAAIHNASHFGHYAGLADDHATTNRGLALSERWVALYSDQIAQFLGTHVIALKAATGTGKSRDFPRVLAQHFRRVIIVEPNRSLCEQMSQYTWVKRSVQMPASGICCMTSGHFVQRLRGAALRLDPYAGGDVIMLDEAHDPSPQTAEAVELLSGFKNLILATATPATDARFAPLGSIIQVDAGFPRPYVTRTVAVWGENPVSVARDALARGARRILVIHPSIKECERLRSQFDAYDIEVSTFNSRSALQLTRVIVASQVADAGVNIDCDVVVDCCLRIVKHRGRIMMIPSDASTAEQRAGRTGRFCDGTCYQLGPIVDANVEMYPTFDQYTQNPALWTRLFKIESDLTQIARRDGSFRLYELRTLDTLGLSREEGYTLARFVTRFDIPADARAGVIELSHDDDSHGDIFGGQEAFRDRIINDPTLIDRFVAATPFVIMRGPERCWVRWLRLKDGTISHETERSPFITGARSRRLLANTQDSVDASFRLPAAAVWGVLNEEVGVRRIVQLWLETFDTSLDTDAVKTKLRHLSNGKVGESMLARNAVESSIAVLAALLHVCVFVSFGETEVAVNLNPTGVHSGPVAMIYITPGCNRLAYWNRATLARGVGRVEAPQRGFSRSAGLAGTDRTWSAVPIGWTGLFEGVLLQDVAYYARFAHYVSPTTNCGAAAISMAFPGMVVRKDVVVNTSDLIEWGRRNFRGLDVAVMQVVGENVFWHGVMPAEARGRLVVLRLENEHYELCVLPLCDSHSPHAIHPMRASTKRCMPAAHFSRPVAQNYDPETDSYLVLVEGGALVADRWMTRACALDTLKTEWPSTAAISPFELGVLDEENETFMAELAAWGSYWRVAIRFRRPDATWSIILPDLSVPGCVAPMLGYVLNVELTSSSKRVRFYHAPRDNRGLTPNNFVFSSFDIAQIQMVASKADIVSSTGLAEVFPPSAYVGPTVSTLNRGKFKWRFAVCVCVVDVWLPASAQAAAIEYLDTKNPGWRFSQRVRTNFRGWIGDKDACCNAPKSTRLRVMETLVRLLYRARCVCSRTNVIRRVASQLDITEAHGWIGGFVDDHAEVAARVQVLANETCMTFGPPAPVSTYANVDEMVSELSHGFQTDAQNSGAMSCAVALVHRLGIEMDALDLTYLSQTTLREFADWLSYNKRTLVVLSDQGDIQSYTQHGEGFKVVPVVARGDHVCPVTRVIRDPDVPYTLDEIAPSIYDTLTFVSPQDDGWGPGVTQAMSCEWTLSFDYQPCEGILLTRRLTRTPAPVIDPEELSLALERVAAGRYTRPIISVKCGSIKLKSRGVSLLQTSMDIHKVVVEDWAGWYLPCATLVRSHPGVKVFVAGPWQSNAVFPLIRMNADGSLTYRVCTTCEDVLERIRYTIATTNVGFTIVSANSATVIRAPVGPTEPLCCRLGWFTVEISDKGWRTLTPFMSSQSAEHRGCRIRLTYLERSGYNAHADEGANGTARKTTVENGTYDTGRWGDYVHAAVAAAHPTPLGTFVGFIIRQVGKRRFWGVPQESRRRAKTRERAGRIHKKDTRLTTRAAKKRENGSGSATHSRSDPVTAGESVVDFPDFETPWYESEVPPPLEQVELQNDDHPDGYDFVALLRKRASKSEVLRKTRCVTPGATLKVERENDARNPDDVQSLAPLSGNLKLNTTPSSIKLVFEIESDMTQTQRQVTEMAVSFEGLWALD